VPLAAVLFVSSGVLDLVDGYVAKKLNKITVFGSFLDSFSDRIADAGIYLGLMVYYLKLQEGIYAGLAIVLLVTAFLISYLRARAEALGLQCKAGLMARAPRFLAVGFGLFFNGLSPWILKIVIWIVAALLVETLAERFIFVWRELEA
jgi:CDP-diacylglycerol--glycerol-3-phosphate 3-phosphatidyltransferase